MKLFIKCMDTECAAERGQEEAARTPLQTRLWNTFLDYKQMDNGTKTTPLRVMIKHMPDVAELILNRCIGQNQLANLFLDYEFVDDTFAKWETKPYTDDINILKSNHPLKMLERYDRKKLLDHPLVRVLLKRKWQPASVIYFSFLCFYAFFVGLLSSYMMSSTPPYVANVTNATDCHQNMQSNFELVVSYLLYVLASAGMISEFIQLMLTKKKYLEFHNTLDWISYISTILILVNLTSCGFRTMAAWLLCSLHIVDESIILPPPSSSPRHLCCNDNNDLENVLPVLYHIVSFCPGLCDHILSFTSESV